MMTEQVKPEGFPAEPETQASPEREAAIRHALRGVHCEVELAAANAELSALRQQVERQRQLYCNTKWLLLFADKDLRFAAFDDEAEARAAYEKAEVQWTCTLYKAVGISGCGPENAMYEPSEIAALRQQKDELLAALINLEQAYVNRHSPQHRRAALLDANAAISNAGAAARTAITRAGA